MDRECVAFGRVQDGSLRVISSALVGPEDRARLPFVAIARIPYKAQADGLPDRGELNRVCREEDRLKRDLSERGCLFAGHVNWHGEMKTIFYCPNRLEHSFTVKSGLFSKQTISLEVRPDETWSVYERELAPTATEYEQFRNLQLLQVLMQHGDNFSKPRPVDFTFIFPDESAVAKLIEDAAGAGFAPGQRGIWQDDVGRFWCELQKETTILRDVIARECAFVRELAERHGGEFDGWACPVTN